MRLLVALLGVAVLAGGSAVQALGHPVLTSRSPVTVLERSCLDPDDAELTSPWVAVGPDGTRVELWCGSRVEVSGGRCRARLGDELTAVPCVGLRAREG